MPTTLKAIGRISIGGEKGKVKTFEDGDTVTGLSKELLEELIAAGSVVSEKKYNRLRPEPEDEEIDLGDEEEEDETPSPPGGGS